MEIILSPNAIDDLSFWKQKNDSRTLKRIRQLVESIQNDPFSEIGKPEPLKYNFKGMWSRRINKKYNIIYEITNNTITIHALKEHY